MCIRDSNALTIRAGGDSDVDKVQIRPGGMVVFSRGTRDADSDTAVATKGYVDNQVSDIAGAALGLQAGAGLSSRLVTDANDSEILHLDVHLSNMGSGLQLVDADGNLADTDDNATLQVDTDFIRSITLAEGHVEFLRDIGNVNEVPPANHTTLTYDDVNDRWVASRDFIDIQATGNFNQTEPNLSLIHI